MTMTHNFHITLFILKLTLYVYSGKEEFILNYVEIVFLIRKIKLLVFNFLTNERLSDIQKM